MVKTENKTSSILKALASNNQQALSKFSVPQLQLAVENLTTGQNKPLPDKRRLTRAVLIKHLQTMAKVKSTKKIKNQGNTGAHQRAVAQSASRLGEVLPPVPRKGIGKVENPELTLMKMISAVKNANPIVDKFERQIGAFTHLFYKKIFGDTKHTFESLFKLKIKFFLQNAMLQQRNNDSWIGEFYRNRSNSPPSELNINFTETSLTQFFIFLLCDQFHDLGTNAGILLKQKLGVQVTNVTTENGKQRKSYPDVTTNDIFVQYLNNISWLDTGEKDIILTTFSNNIYYQELLGVTIGKKIRGTYYLRASCNEDGYISTTVENYRNSKQQPNGSPSDLKLFGVVNTTDIFQGSGARFGPFINPVILFDQSSKTSGPQAAVAMAIEARNSLMRTLSTLTERQRTYVNIITIANLADKGVGFSSNPIQIYFKKLKSFLEQSFSSIDEYLNDDLFQELTSQFFIYFEPIFNVKFTLNNNFIFKTTLSVQPSGYVAFEYGNSTNSFIKSIISADEMQKTDVSSFLEKTYGDMSMVLMALLTQTISSSGDRMSGGGFNILLSTLIDTGDLEITSFLGNYNINNLLYIFEISAREVLLSRALYNNSMNIKPITSVINKRNKPRYTNTNRALLINNEYSGHTGFINTKLKSNMFNNINNKNFFNISTDLRKKIISFKKLLVKNNLVSELYALLNSQTGDVQVLKNLIYTIRQNDGLNISNADVNKGKIIRLLLKYREVPNTTPVFPETNEPETNEPETNEPEPDIMSKLGQVNAMMKSLNKYTQIKKNIPGCVAPTSVPKNFEGNFGNGIKELCHTQKVLLFYWIIQKDNSIWLWFTDLKNDTTNSQFIEQQKYEIIQVFKKLILMNFSQSVMITIQKLLWDIYKKYNITQTGVVQQFEP